MSSRMEKVSQLIRERGGNETQGGTVNDNGL